jgi:hypothetical protein
VRFPVSWINDGVFVKKKSTLLFPFFFFLFLRFLRRLFRDEVGDGAKWVSQVLYVIYPDGVLLGDSNSKLHGSGEGRRICEIRNYNDSDILRWCFRICDDDI